VGGGSNMHNNENADFAEAKKKPQEDKEEDVPQ
jgi:hypothetical protein